MAFEFLRKDIIASSWDIVHVHLGWYSTTQVQYTQLSTWAKCWRAAIFPDSFQIPRKFGSRVEIERLHILENVAAAAIFPSGRISCDTGSVNYEAIVLVVCICSGVQWRI